MRRYLPKIAVAGILSVIAACASPTKPGETFTVSGVVRASATSVGLANATIEGVGSGADGQSTTATAGTDAEGRYSLSGLRDAVTLRVRHAAHYPVTSHVQLRQDLTMDFVMEAAAPPLGEGGDLVLGQTISSSLGAADVRCDPQWDSNSPCRRFGFTPEVTGSYEFTLRFPPVCQLELHLLKDGQRLFATAVGRPIVRSADLSPGFHEVRVMAYYACDWFELTVR